MKLLTYEYQGMEHLGILDQSETRIIPLVELGIKYASMNDLIIEATKNGEIKKMNAIAKEQRGELELSAVGRLAPIPQPLQDIICVGFNYIDHVREIDSHTGISSGTAPGELPEWPTYFSKRVNGAVGYDGDITSHDHLDECIDYEAELGVIIGRTAKNVSPENVWEHIFGFTIINDVSSRTIQARHKQFYLGKSLDGSCIMGPWIVTKDEFEKPLKIDLKCYVNGELRQHSNTNNMIFGIERIISELSQGMTLRAGTVISTGTCAGTGAGLTPPQYLKAGDLVEIVIEGIGSMRNKVVVKA